MAIAVNQPSDEMNEALPVLKKLDALMGGTSAMRKAGQDYLPKWPLENELQYEYRRKTSTLYNAFAKTIKSLSAKPFLEPITYEGFDADTEAWFENIDLAGNKLDLFAHGIFEDGLADGLTHILVDFPTTNGELKTVADEKSAGVRPYMVQIDHDRVLGWQTALINGVVTLTQIRFMECVEEPDGQWGTKEVEQVRLLEPGKWQKWRAPETTATNDGTEWVLYEEGVTTLSYIPWVTFYTGRCDYMEARPPLEDLADLNIKHWQSSSDQDKLLHTARVPILARIGYQGDENTMAIGPSVLDIPAGGDIKYVEHTGKAIDAGRTSLQDLEQQMESLGAELLTAKPGNKTATQSAIDSSQAQSQLQEMVGELEDALDQAIDIMLDWVGKKTDSTGHVTVYKDFATIQVNGQTVQPFVSALGVLNTMAILSKEDVFNECKRYGVINPDLIWEEVEARIANEGPALLGVPGSKPPTESITENVRI